MKDPRTKGLYVQMAVFRSSTLYRHYGTWWKQILNRTSPQLSRTQDEDRTISVESSVQLEPSQFLEQLVKDHLPHCHDDWMSTPLGHNTDLKAKVLLSCEKQFDYSFGDRCLGSIQTVQDVLNIISRPKRSPPRTVFPRIERTESIPVNLCVQAASVRPSSKKRERQPFQNYDLPEHSSFLNKRQKEARKRKRRHLTAITKYYAS